MISRRQIQFYRPIVQQRGYLGATKINRVRDFNPIVTGEITLTADTPLATSMSADFGFVFVAEAPLATAMSASIADTSIYVGATASTASTMQASFGIDTAGAGTVTTMSATLSNTAYLTVSGVGPITTMAATIVGYSPITMNVINQIQSAMTGAFGIDATGAGTVTTMSATMTAPAVISLSATAPLVSTMTATIQDIGVITLTAEGGLTTSTLFIDLRTEAGLVSTMSAHFADTVVNAIAYVLNTETNETTRYTNYGFDHIVIVGDTPVGVRSDGLYWLTGDTDLSVFINGEIVTKDTDFGSFKSKRVEYVYLNSDTDTTVQPIVDGVVKPTHPSSFGGRKAKLALGNSGRYWQFRISKIRALDGVEILPMMQQRRYK